jgi:hypothetical protein
MRKEIRLCVRNNGQVVQGSTVTKASESFRGQPRAETGVGLEPHLPVDDVEAVGVDD